MNQEFFKGALKVLLPVAVVFSFLFVSGHLSSDFFFHAGNRGGDYPPFLSWIMPDYNRADALFIYNLAFSLVIPFCLIHKITKRIEAAAVYAYSGIPLVLFVVWLVPQSILQCLMLFAVISPWGLGIFILIGWAIHTYWGAGYLLVCGYLAYRKFKTGKFYV